MTYHGNQLAEVTESLWFCLRAQPKREHIAAARLRQIEGLEVLAPQIRFRKSTRRGAVWFVEALFPGYLFARFHFAALHRHVQSVPGVSGVVHFGDRIPVIDPITIAQVTAVAGDREVIVIDPKHSVGDDVQFAQGPFQGLQGIVTQVSSSAQRVKVLLEFLGREVETEVSTSELVRKSLPRALIEPPAPGA